jgi:multidrug resistance efflux pump
MSLLGPSFERVYELEARITSLEAALATARADAFEEAAKVAERTKGLGGRFAAADEIATVIRALTSQAPERLSLREAVDQFPSTVLVGAAPERTFTLAEVNAAAHKAMDGSGGEPVYPWMDKFRAALTGEGA